MESQKAWSVLSADASGRDSRDERKFPSYYGKLIILNTATGSRRPRAGGAVSERSGVSVMAVHYESCIHRGPVPRVCPVLG
jgi:hypothetical protein